MESKAKQSILYIDDEDGNLEIFKATFRHEFNVITANSPKQGYHFLRETEIDVIISDYRMPEKNGVDFLGEIFRDFPETVRIILTAYANPDVVAASINKAHVFGFADKPWDKDEFGAMLRSATAFAALRK